MLLLFRYKEKPTKLFRQLVLDVNTITFSGATSKKERHQKIKKVTEADEFSEKGNAK